MAFTGNYICTSFKKECLEGKHKLRASGGHTFKIALYDNNASFTHATTDYTTTNEVTGTNYSAGGIALTVIDPDTSGTTAFADFADATFTNVTLTARGAIIYNSTTDGGSDTTEAVAVLDFGLDRTATAQNFKIEFPTGDALNAIVRIQ